MSYRFNPFTGNFDVVDVTTVPDPLVVDNLTVNTLLTAEHIHGNIAGTVYIHIKNLDTAPLAKGTPFYISGTVGSSDRVEVKAADATDPTKGPAVGLIEDTLAINGEGNGVLLGEIFQYDTDTPGWATNDALYVAAGGGLTNVEPTTGYRQVVGYAGRIHSETGTIVVVSNAAQPVAGSDTQIQYNDNGGFGASADLTWDDSTKELGVGGDINLDDGGTYETTVQVVTPTANRTISFPDATGTVALVAGSSGQLTYNNAGAQAGLTSASIGSAGEITNTLAGAASTPPVSFTGSWFTGGTSTTTKPQVLIEPTGATSTAWSTSGTGIGVNAASGFNGRLLDLQLNGTSRMVVQADGKVGLGTTVEGQDNADNLTIADSGSCGITIRSASNNFGRIYFSDGTSGDAEYRGIVQYDHTNDRLQFAANALTAMTIDSSQRVGIGTTSPNAPLAIQANSTAEGIKIQGRATDDIGEFAFFENDGTTEIGRIQARTTELNFRARQSGQSITFITGGITERARIDSSGRLLVGTSSNRAVGAGLGAYLQVEGIQSTLGKLSITQNSSSAFAPARISLGKSKGTTVGSNTIVADNDYLGIIEFAGADGTDLQSIAALIKVEVDGTPGANDMPGRIVMSVTLDGASAPTEAFRITNDRVRCYNQPAPTIESGAATLTVAELKTGIIEYTGSADTLTLPTGTLMEGGFSGIYTNMTFEWSVINTGSGTCTIGTDTGHTIVGAATVANGASGRFASRRTGSNTFVTYRLA